MTEKDVANLLKVTKGKYLSWENDLEDIPQTYLYSLVYLYGVSYDELLAYEKPDSLEYPMRLQSVRKKYTKRITKIWIAVTLAIAAIAIIIFNLVRLSPQIHSKYHSDSVYHTMIDNIHKEISEDTKLSDVLAYVNANSGLKEEYYVSSVAVVPVTNKHMVFYNNGNQYGIIDVRYGYLVVAHGYIEEGDYKASFDVVKYSIWCYVVIHEDDDTPFSDVIDCYSEYLSR